jgi:hypothetical protein
LNLIERIQKEFGDMDLNDKYYLTNMGLGRALDRLSKFNDILAATNYRPGDHPIWLTH